MMVKLFILLVTLNTVASHMLLKRAIQDFGQPSSFAEMPAFIASAAVSPWVWCSLVLQVVGYIGWMVVITHEKLGVATASVGATYYLLTATAAWLIFGERLGSLQWFGIALITVGLVCVSVVPNK
jgi:drug/metabolite transporter (DMT)-like permease